MLYELFMHWIVGSIGMVVVSMVVSGLLCVWCASQGSKRNRLASNHCPHQLSASHEADASGVLVTLDV